MFLNGGGDWFANEIGVKLSVVIAGFIGALVAGLIDRGPVWERLTSVLVGFACSIYFTPFAVPLVVKFLGEGEANNIQNGAAFFVGMAGLVVARSILDVVRDFFSKFQK